MKKTYSLLVLVVAFSVVLSLGLAFEPLADSPTGFQTLITDSSTDSDTKETSLITRIIKFASFSSLDTSEEFKFEACETESDCDLGQECSDSGYCEDVDFNTNTDTGED